MSAAPQFSVIVPAEHGGDYLRETLVGLGRLESPPQAFEVIVAGSREDRDSQNAVEQAGAESPVRFAYVGCEGRGRAARLNAACGAAQGRVLAFCDDDCVPCPGWLQALAEPLADAPDAGAVGGPDQLMGEGGSFDRALDWVLRSPLGTGGLRGGGGARVGPYYPRLWNMAVPRHVALEVARVDRDGRPLVFDESLAVHEDVDLGARIAQTGRKMVRAPNARVEHRRATTFGRLLARDFRMGQASRRLGVHRLPHATLAAGLLAAPALAALAAFWMPALIPLLVGAAAYGALLLCAGVSGAVTRRDPRLLLLAPCLLAGLHAARGLGFLCATRRRNGGKAEP